MEKIKFQKVPKSEQIKDFLARKFVPYPIRELETLNEFKKLLQQVLGQIWDEIKTEDERIQSIHLVMASMAYPIIFYPSHWKEKDSRTACMWLILFDHRLAQFLSDKEWRRYVRYVVCHEFCHVKLRHGARLERVLGKVKADIEREANDLAAKWGFPPPQPTDPKEKRTVGALLDELKEPLEGVNATYRRLLKQGIIKEGKSKTSKKKGG